MERIEDIQGSASYIYYQTIIEKLNSTIAYYNQLPEQRQCLESFDLLELAAYSRDAQINHLLQITMQLIKYVPNSSLLEEVFTNFMQDYLHLVNPGMPPYPGIYYIADESVKILQCLPKQIRLPELWVVS